MGVHPQAYGQQRARQGTALGPASGDRVPSVVKNLDQWIPAALSREDYRIGPGDVLDIRVQGKANLGYTVRPVAEGDATTGTSAGPHEVAVSPSGDIQIPLAGKIRAAGKTVSELEETIHTALSKYIRQFSVSVSVAQVRTINIWISGQVANPGPQVLPAVSTVSLAVLQAGIKPSGSTRRISLTRGGKQHTVDLYKMMITGNVDLDIPLEPGDSIHVPPVTEYVQVTGEVTRPGRYEMIGLEAGAGSFSVQDLISLSLGVTPAAAQERSFIERIDSDGRKFSVSIDLRSAGKDTPMQAGDTLVVTSVEAFQPIIRMTGEFKGDGVYQRAPGSTQNALENRSGIYFLKRGQTVLDVITATGGVTPQADLKRARIEREENGKVVSIPVDLDRLLVQNDKSADVTLVNGDLLVLPTTADKIHVFGSVRIPGSVVYSPSRKLIDYLGDAGGPTEQARLTDVSVVRGADGTPEITRYNVERTIRGGVAKGNPELMPGDVVFVPQKFVSNWRDGLQLVFSAVSLASLLGL